MFAEHDAAGSSESDAKTASDESADLSDDDIEEAVALLDEDDEAEGEL